MTDGTPRSRRATPQRLGIACLVAVAAVVAACSNIVGPDDDFEPAILVSGDEGPSIALPDTVQRGVPFTVALLSYGGGCIQKGDMRVNLSGGAIRLQPFDLHLDSDTCTTEVRIFEHRATLAVNESRTYEVRIEGWAQPADSAVTFRRTLVVR